MLAWLQSNLATIVILIVFLAIVGLVIRGMVKDKRSGKSSCGGSCSGCTGCAGCVTGNSCHTKH